MLKLRNFSAMTLTLVPLLAATLEAAPSLDGRWKAVVSTEDGEHSFHLDVTQKGEVLTGNFISSEGKTFPVKSGSINGQSVSMKVERELDGNLVLFALTGKLSGRTKIEGTVSAKDEQVATFTFSRLPSPAATWKVRALSPDGDRTFESVLTVKASEDGYRAKFKSDRGEIDAKNIGWKGDGLFIELSVPIQDKKIPVRIEADFKDSNALKGKWRAVDTEYTGEWSAVREIKLELAGVWNVDAQVGDNVYKSTTTVANGGDGYKGAYSGDLGEIAYKRVAVEKDTVTLELQAEIDGEDVTFEVKVKFQDENTLKGRWQVKSDSTISGEWTARRKASPEASPKAAEKSKKVSL